MMAAHAETRFPVRDPFFKMLRRSLANFMNAFTSADHTSYPFATTNRRDFDNLLHVYLDATLSPLLRENDFYQEGWRLALDPGKTATKDAVFRGIVYNEMKGQMSDSSYFFYVKFQNIVFPDLYNSGGNPQAMTELTHQDLKRYHRKHYHPSNAKLLTYGNMPLHEHAQLINSYLAKFRPKKLSKQPLKQPRQPNESERYIESGPVDPLLPLNQQHKTSLSWITSSTSDVVETFALGVLSSLLLDGYGSPMYTALVAGGLGTDFSPNTGFDPSARLGIFSIGLNGVAKNRVAEVEAVVHRTLAESFDRGFDPIKINGMLHQLELALKHKTANFGMGIIGRIQPGWFNGVDPFDTLAWNDTVDAFKARLSEGRYLESLLQKYLMNGKEIAFTMKPDANFAGDLKEEEASRIEWKLNIEEQATGSLSAVDELLQKCESSLRKEQEMAPNQDLSSLPTVRVSDISFSKPEQKVREMSIDNVKTQWRECSTNGLTYFRALHVIRNLPDHLRMLVPLFTDCLMRLGTKSHSMEELEDLIKLNTGGLGISYHSAPDPGNPLLVKEGLSFSGYALDSKVTLMYDLLRQLLLETDFDSPEAEQRIRQLLQAEASGALDAVAASGHSYARRHAESFNSEQGLNSEQVGGLKHVQHVADLARRDDLKDVIEDLKKIQAFVLRNCPSLQVAINCGPEAVATNEVALSRFLASFPASPVSLEASRSSHGIRNRTHFQMPFQVSYTAQIRGTVAYTHQASAPLQIAAQLLTHKYLHHEIREKGGAYGGGAYFKPLSGVFGCYSYRDPSPANSLDIFRGAGQWIHDKNWTAQDIEEAKLSLFQSIDAPRSVADEGMTRFLSGIDHEMEQLHRQQLLSVTSPDIHDVARRFLIDPFPSTTVLGENRDWIHGEEWQLQQIKLGT